MNALKSIGLLVVFVFAAVAAIYGYMGGFVAVKIEQGAFGPSEIIYSTHVGPYQEIGESWARFDEEWQEAGLNSCDSLAIYLDPPDTPPEELRSILACQIDALTEDDKAALKEEFPSFVMPQSDALLSAFPFRNFASYMLAPRKVYPEMQKRMTAKNIVPPVGVELYGDMDNVREIRFAIPYGVDKTAYQPLFDAF